MLGIGWCCLHFAFFVGNWRNNYLEEERILWRHMCGILPKNCHVAPSPLDTQTVPCDAWHSSLHLDISHPEFYPANVLPYPDVSQPQFYPADIPSSPDGRGGRFNFPGQTCPDPLVTLTWTAYLDSLARQILAIRRIHFRPQ